MFDQLYLPDVAFEGVELEILADLSTDIQLVVGVVNQKKKQIESIEKICNQVEWAIVIFTIERVMLTPDCQFATFAGNPIASTQIATDKLRVISQSRQLILG